VGECLLTLRLRLVAMHDHRGYALRLQVLDEAVGSPLRAHKDERSAAVLVAKLPDKSLELRMGPDVDEAVHDVAAALGGGAVDVAARLAGVRRCLPACRALERRREEQRLAITRHAGDDPIDCRLEAHVEHAVGLVEHQYADVCEAELAPLEQVFEAPGSRDHDVGTSGELCLALETDPTVDDRDGQGASMRNVAQLANDLAGKLSGRSENERRRSLCIGLHAVDDRYTESEGLARSRRRLSKDIATGETVGDNQPLNGKGRFDATFGERLDDCFGRAEIGEGWG
jgi:hypothetical protein